MTPGAALLVALFSQTAPAAPRGAGEPPPARLKLEVRGGAGCVTRADLAARIAARTAHVEIGDEAPLAAQVTLTSAHPGKVVADLALGGEPARRVTARSCAEVADGLGLIIAVTLDPSLRAPEPEGTAAGAAGIAGPTAQPKPAPMSAVPSRRTAGPQAKPAGVPKPPPPPEAPRPEPVAAAPPIAQPLPARTPAAPELDASLGGQAIFGPAPAVMPGVALYVTAALDREGPWAPALTVGAMHAWRSDLAERGGTASFALDAGSIDACPVRVRLWRVTARPCLAALVGRLAAQGSNTPGPTSPAPRPFAAAGAALTASYGSTIQVSARLGLGVTIIRDAYEFATDVFYRAGLFTVSAGVGVGVRWR